jgi:arylsulfatase A-like enzyme
VAHQRYNTTTDLISPQKGIGLDRLVFGWQIKGEGEGSFAEIAKRAGRVEVFSSDGDLTTLEADLSVSAGSLEPRQVNVALNGSVLESLDITMEWVTHRVEIPATQVRIGVNIFELRTGYVPNASKGLPSVRLRRLRLESRSGRPVWLQRPEVIGSPERESGAASDQAVEMPNASHLDMVLQVPAGARLIGNVELAPADGKELEPVEVFVRLLDERLTERQLMRQHLQVTPTSRCPLAVDLAPWSGQLVRLRLGTTGSGNALVRWLGVGITAPRAPVRSIPQSPIDLVVPARTGRLGRPNVLVVLLDAARADAFSPLGGSRATPAAERLAHDGTVFERALAPAPWTGESVPAMLTGLYSDALGVDVWGSSLPEKVPTLAEFMLSAGYRTALWSQHVIYWASPGLERGFEKTHHSKLGFQVTPGATNLLADGEPFLAFVHLVPPHLPYEPPAPYRGLYSSWYEGEMAVDVESLGRYMQPGERRKLSQADVRYVRDRYEENVAFADALLAELLDLLDQRDKYAETLVILLSDHGEAFLEHGRFKHGTDVHREMLHVPLIVKWPASVAGFRSVVAEPVTLLDLVPTLVDGLSLPSGGHGFQGRSLLPLAFQGPDGHRVLYAVTRGTLLDPAYAPRPRLMLESNEWRLLYDPLTERSKLFRGDRDPMEEQNLAFREPLRALSMRQSLLIQRAWNRQLRQRWQAESEAKKLDPELTEQLRALGYVN